MTDAADASGFEASCQTFSLCRAPKTDDASSLKARLVQLLADDVGGARDGHLVVVRVDRHVAADEQHDGRVRAQLQ